MTTKHTQLQTWVNDKAALFKPESIVWCDGSKAEYNRMWQLMVLNGTAKPLNRARRPNSYYVRSVPEDVARVEDRTFI
ncbi:MAG: pckG, partial [Gammaproteobacteria bacterium]|nr:pckG [Gammaproteobacteria bacterium]